jgi:hypothetical protein
MAHRIRQAWMVAMAIVPIWAVTLFLSLEVNMRRW